MPINPLQDIKPYPVAGIDALGIQNTILAREEAKRQRALAEQQAQQRMMVSQEFFAKPNPSNQDILRFISVQDPKISESMKEVIGNIGKDRMDSEVRFYSNILGSLMVDPNTSITLLNEKATALENAGDKQTATMLRSGAEDIKKNGPGNVTKLVTMVLSGMPGGRDAIKTMAEVNKQKEEKAAGAPHTQIAEDGSIMQWDPEKQTWFNTGMKARPQAAGVTIANYGAPVQAIEKTTGEPVFIQPSSKGGGAIIPGVRPITEADKKALTQSAKELGLFNDIALARSILRSGKPTGSYAGAAMTSGKRFLGMSDEATQANAQLKAIGAGIMMALPRLEGPQSEADRRFYEEQSGKIGDQTLPIQDRLAALDALDKRFAGSKNTGSTKPSMGVETKVNPSNGKTYYKHPDGKFYLEPPK